MEHVKFTHQRSSRVIVPHTDDSHVVATHIVAWVEGYERPLLCARLMSPLHIAAGIYTGGNQTYAKLWTSPLRYSDPPSDIALSPTGAPWVVYCERHTSQEPLPPLWFEARMSRTELQSGVTADSYWGPLSADWTLKGALAPVVKVVRDRHQPFLARLVTRSEKGNEAVFRPIDIGEETCPECEGHGRLGQHVTQQVNGKGAKYSKTVSWLCDECGGTGTLPRWSLSVQCGWPPFGTAPLLRKSAVDNDISQFYLWEVSSNINEPELWDILHRHRPEAQYGLCARVCNGEHDPARDVYAAELQLVIDALEAEAANTGGPVLAPPDERCER